MTLKGWDRGQAVEERDRSYGRYRESSRHSKAQNVLALVGAITGVVLTILAIYMLTQSLGNPGISNEHTLLFFAIAFASGATAPATVRVLRTVASKRLYVSELEARRSNGALGLVDRDEKHAERQILEALERCGEVTPAKAAVETSLAVDEADRVLSDMVHRGFVEVRVEDGKLIYRM